MSNSDKTVLDGDAAGLIQALTNATMAWNAYNKHMIESVAQSGQVLSATNRLNNALKKYTTSARSLNTQQEKVTKTAVNARIAISQVGTATARAASAASAAKTKTDGMSKGLDEVDKKAKKADKSVKQMSISFKGMVRLVGVQLAHRAISAMVRGLREGFTAAVQIQKALSEVRTISQNNQLALQEWRAEAVRLSNTYGRDVKDQIEATYQALSNQVGEGAEVFGFLEESNKFASAAVATTTDSVNLLSSALNSFGLESDQTERVAAVLFKTIELGRVRASEMANSFGDLAVLSNQIGLSIEELGAAISTLTVQGIKQNKAATQLRGIFVKLLKPTKAMSEFFRSLGVNSGEAAIKTFGFAGVMERLRNTTKGSATELNKYISRVRGLTGGLVFTNEGLELFKKNLEENKNAQESYNKALDETLENSGKKVEIFFTRIGNTFKDLGDTIIEFYADWLDADEKTQAEINAKNRSDAIKKEFDDILRNFDQISGDQIKIERQNLARYIALKNDQADAAVKSYNVINEAATRSAATFIDSVSESISEAKSKFGSLQKDIVDANKRIADLIREEDKTLFEWAQSTRDAAEQIDAIGSRIAELQELRTLALIANNKKAFDSLNSEIIGLIKKRRDVDMRAQAENKSALEEQKTLAREIAKIKGESAKELVKLNKELRGKTGADRGKVEQKIREEAEKTAAKLKEIAAEQAKVTTLDLKRIGHASDFRKELDTQKKGYELLIESAGRLANVEKQRIVDQELLKIGLQDLLKGFKDFDVSGALRTTDAGKLKEIIAARQSFAKSIAEFQKQRGIDSPELKGVGQSVLKETNLMIKALEVLEEVRFRQAAIGAKEAQIRRQRAQIDNLKKLRQGASDVTAAYEKAVEAANALSKLKARDISGSATTGEFYPAAEAIKRIQQTLETAFKDGKVKNAGRALDALKRDLIAVGQIRGKSTNEHIDRLDALFHTLNKLEGTEVSRFKNLKNAEESLERMQKNLKETETKNKSILSKIKAQNAAEAILDTTTRGVIKTQQSLLEVFEKQTQEIEKQNNLRDTFDLDSLTTPQGGDGLKTQLSALNSPPQASTNSTSNAYGPFNISMQSSGNAGYDAVQLGREIQKAARRGLLS